jgi:beta-barrel assembly-enhancing protease
MAFEGWVSHPSLGEEVVWGRILFEGWRLRFESETVTREVPLVKLQIARDEAAQGGLLFYDPDDADWLIHTLDQKILEAVPLRQQAHTRHQIQEMQSGRELMRRLKITGAFLAGFALLALLVSLLMGMMVRSLVAKVPPEWEQELGEQTIADLKQQETFVEDAKLQTNLLRAVAPLVQTLPTNAQGLKFYIVQSPMANAFALPGGYVVVTTRLLEMAERPEEVAGVVAHELAHLKQKHALRKILSSAGPYILCGVFLRGNSGLMGVLAGSSQLMVCQTFSQEYELEADDVGWQLLLAAHIDPRGLPEMLKKLNAEQARLKLVGLAPQAFSSHPATAKRIRRLEAKWRKLNEKSGFIVYEKNA